MRQRAHSSVIAFATLLAWLLVTPDRASANGITVIVPVDVTNLHEDVEKIRLMLTLKQGTQRIGSWLTQETTVVDGSVQEDVEISINADPNSLVDGQNIFDADSFEILMSVKLSGIEAIYCMVNWNYGENHACNDGRANLQTYENLSGSISDLIPE